jgi:hypothetical protein
VSAVLDRVAKWPEADRALFEERAALMEVGNHWLRETAELAAYELISKQRKARAASQELPL